MCWYLTPSTGSKVAVLPQWMDCTLRNYSAKKSATFLGFVRAILALVSFGTCVAFAANANGVLDNPSVSSSEANAVRGILIFISIINVIHLIGACILIYLAQSSDLTPRQVKNWMIADCAVTAVFLIGILILLFNIPSNGTRIYLILGIKLIFLSMLFLWRNWYTYNLSLGPNLNVLIVQDSVQHHGVVPVTMTGQPVNQPYFVNVQKV